jgi:two-component system NtrC family sensor kinase
MQVHVHEVTERKKIEQQLRKYEKLSALGQLIAGVAHELNNPLAVIMGYSQLLTKRADVPEKTKTELQKILHESERAAKIVRNLLTFSRPREPEMTTVQLNQVVAGVVDACTPEIKSNAVDIQLRLSEQLPRTKADPNQLEQVITNLITNAIHAQQKQTSARRLEISTREYGAYIRITVADNGPGIPGELLTKIFEPFFTTKSPGQGTGLGLAISRAIIEEHHGKLWAQSEPGKGARFFVELPIIPCAEDRPATGGTAHITGVMPDEEALENARHRILIVDDEPGIVEVLKEALSFSGYTIDTACNGAVALQKITQETYDLVLSDLRMPDMDGEKLYHTVRRLKPGDTVSSNARTFLEWTGNRWFSKPFNMAELEEVIHNYLRPPALATMVQ